MSTVFKQLRYFSTVRKLVTLSFGAIALFISYNAIAWYVDRTHGAHYKLSEHSAVDLSVSGLYLVDGVVSYSEDGQRIGQTILTNDFLYDPLAIFPCPDHHSVICLSWPDTWQAAFTIDFSKRHPEGAIVPDPLKGIVVDSSDFEVRACTPKEVEYVKNFIRAADLKTFEACTRWGTSEGTEDEKNGILDFLESATSPHNSRLENSPLLLPEEPSMADTP